MFFDIPKSTGINFQNPASPIAEGLIDLHHYIFHYLLGILALVLYLFFVLIKNNKKK